MYSLAETTIHAHHLQGGIWRDARPLVKGPDGKLYPRHPLNDYVSCFADGFSGCLVCGSKANLFQICPPKEIKEKKQNKFQNIWGLVPSTRKIGSFPVVQSYSLLTNPSLTNPTPIIKASFCEIFTIVKNVMQPTNKSMSISITESLPSVCLHLGSVEDEEKKLRMWVDTEPVMNIGNLLYHFWVMSEYTEMVGEYIQCGDK